MFQPIDRNVCDLCRRPLDDYYAARKRHMADSFKAGIPPTLIADGYRISPDWAMKLIREQLGDDAVGEVIDMFRVRICEFCGERITKYESTERVNGNPVHTDCLMSQLGEEE